MKIKLGWGSAILILILIFFGSLAVRIYIAFQRDVNLVVKDYYPQEIVHQQIIDKKINASALSEMVKINLQKDSLMMVFPREFENKMIKGSISFYRPSDPTLDQEYQFPSKPGRNHSLHVYGLKRGKYILKLDWTGDSTGYYLEKEIFVD